MTMQWVLGVTLVLYLLVMYGLALVAQRRIHDNEDYLVAGRRLPLSLAWMTLLATWFGAGTLLTASDEVRREGLSAAALDPLGAGLCLLLAGWLVAGPMWRARLLTVPDLFARKFGKSAELVCALIMVPSYFGWIAAQFVALAGMLELFFGIDLRLGLLLVAAVGTGYTLMGGMWSVTLTDAVQILLVMVCLLVLAAVVLWELGDQSVVRGLDKLASQTPGSMRTVIPLGSAQLLLQWLTVLAIGALGNLPGQDLMQRIFAAKSATVARRACWIAGGCYLTFGCLPLVLALSGNLLLPQSLEKDILPALASAFFSPVLTVVFVLALTSAVLSTIDSAILAPSSVLAQNVFSKLVKIPLLSLNRWSVLLVACCSLVMAYSGESAYSLLESAYALTLVGLLVPMLFGLYTTPRNRHAAVASMLVGSGVWLLHLLLGWEAFLAPLAPFDRWQLPVSLVATLLGLVAYLLVEPRGKKPAPLPVRD